MAIIAQGASLEVLVNGTSVLSALDPDIASGSIALYSWANLGAAFDDVLVTGLDAGNAAPVVTAVSATPSSITDLQTSQLAVTAVDPDAGPAALG